jgi:hypothetical protein
VTVGVAIGSLVLLVLGGLLVFGGAPARRTHRVLGRVAAVRVMAEAILRDMQLSVGAPDAAADLLEIRVRSGLVRRITYRVMGPGAVRRQELDRLGQVRNERTLRASEPLELTFTPDPERLRITLEASYPGPDGTAPDPRDVTRVDLDYAETATDPGAFLPGWASPRP